MDEIIKKIVEIATGKKAKLFWAVFLGTFILFLVLYPYIDANFLIYNRINKRIEILDKLTDLDTTKIATNANLQNEYDSILNEIVSAHNKSFGSLSNNVDTSKHRNIKFISGGILFWFVSIILLFSKNKNQGSIFKKTFYKLSSVLLCVAIGYILALMGKNIPTFFNVWINAIVFPIIQITFIGLLIYGTNSNNKK